MCTTAARFSESFYHTKAATGTAIEPPPPPPSSTSHHPEEELLGYNNVILLHETAHEIGAEAIVTNSETLEEAPRPDTLPLQTLQTQLHVQEGTFVSNYQYMHYEQTALAHETASSTQVTGMLVHRSPNGHLYQQNYLVNAEHVTATAKDAVEYVQIQTHHADANVMFATETTAAVDTVTERAHLNSFELSHQYDDYQHAAQVVDENSAELIAQYTADLANVPVVNENYTAVDDRHLTAPNKDEQRLLLESTMSPLLAAVNDITKRDAELQLYLSQNLEKDSTQYLTKDINRFEQTSTTKATTQQESPQNSSDEDDYLLVSDKAVECRAKASLPTNYLYFGEINSNTSEPCVFAKKLIPRRTMFGPYEGQVVYVTEIDLDVLHVQTPRCNPVLMVDESHILDVSNEDASNWMRYIRLAQCYAQQNLQLLHEDGKLFLRCVRDIRANEELRVGYHSSYAERFLLPTLQPTAEDLKDDFYRKHPWKCFECKQRFANSAEMKLHLNEHDDAETPQLDKEIQTKKHIRKFNKTKAKSCPVKMYADSRRCHLCAKVFMTNETLKQHIAKQHKDQHNKVHFLNRKSSKSSKNVQLTDTKYMYKCNLCAKRFHKETLLVQHKSTHEGCAKKPHQCQICQQRCATPAALAAHLQGHEALQYTCVFCAQKFKYVRDFKKHVAVHKTGNNGFFECPHCKKQYADYHLVRKHVRIFHSNREFFCSSCGKKFHNSYALQRHRQTHLENKSFACTACGKQFGRKDHLLTHTKRKHSPNVQNNAKTSSETAQKDTQDKASLNNISSSAMPAKQCSSPVAKSSEQPNETGTLNDGTQYLKMSPMKQPPPMITATTSSSSNRRKQTPTKLKALELNADTVTFVALSEMLSPFIISESALNADFKIASSSSNSNVNTAAAAANKSETNENNSIKAPDTTPENAEKTTECKSSTTETAAKSSTTVPSPLYPFSCHICPHSSFKRRGMLVNHMAKVHPTVNIEQLETLKAPIVKQLLIFPCPYCSNVYKLNAKRKAHIIKHHPGRELPASMRKTRANGVEVAQAADVAQAALLAHSAEVAATVGTLEVKVHKCDRCYKQYAARSRLVSHYRKAHPEQTDLPVRLNASEEFKNKFPTYSTPSGELLQQHPAALEPEINIIPYQLQSPVSPENKLLKLSSAAALELSRFDDDYFNERMRCTNDEEVVVPTVFADQATHSDLQHLPALFEESAIVGIDATSMEKYNRSIETQFFEKITKFS